MGPPSIDIMASDQVSGPAMCFQIGTPTAEEFCIGTPTKKGFKIKDDEVDECFDCDDSDDDNCSRASDDSDCESDAETEASPVNSPNVVAAGQKLSWNEVAERSSRVKYVCPPAVEQKEPQEPNWKLEAAMHMAGQRGFGAGIETRIDSDSDSDDELLGCRRDNLDDDFEIGSIGEFSDIEL